MESLPIFIKIKDARCLVVGGGEVALRKVTTLLKAEAKVEVVAPALCDELAQFARDGKITSQAGVFEPSQLNCIVLVFAATDDEAVNLEVSRRKSPKYSSECCGCARVVYLYHAIYC